MRLYENFEAKQARLSNPQQERSTMSNDMTSIIAAVIIGLAAFIGVLVLLHRQPFAVVHPTRRDLETPCTNCGDKKEDHELVSSRICKMCVCPGFEG